MNNSVAVKLRRSYLPRFSLRTLLILVLLAASGFGLLWEWEPWAPTGVRIENRNETKTVLFSPDGTRIAIYWQERSAGNKWFLGAEANRYSIFDARSGGEVADLSGGYDNTGFGGGAQVCISPNGKWLHATSHDNIVHWEGIWKLWDGKPVVDFEVNSYFTTSYSKRGRFLALHPCGGPGVPRLIDGNSGKCIETEAVSSQMTFSGDEAVAAVRKDKNQVYIYETKSWRNIGEPIKINGEEFGSFNFALDQDGTLLLVSHYSNNKPIAINTQTREQAFSFLGYIPDKDGLSYQCFFSRTNPGFLSDYFSSNGRFFCSIKKDGSGVWIWHEKDGVSIEISNNCPNIVNSAITFSTDGRRLLVCDPGVEVGVWDAESGLKIWGRKGRVTASSDVEVVIECRDRDFVLLNATNGYEYYQSPLVGAKLQFGYLSADQHWLLLADTEALAVWERRRPEQWWGVAWLPEFWLTVVFSIALIWSLRRDWKTLRGKNVEAKAVVETKSSDA